jgi:hypothetical protein
MNTFKLLQYKVLNYRQTQKTRKWEWGRELEKEKGTELPCLFKEGLNLEIKRLLRVKSPSELAQDERIFVNGRCVASGIEVEKNACRM